MGALVLDPRTGRRHFRETLAAGATGAPVMIGRDILPATVSVYPSAGATGRIEYTLAPPADVQAGAATVVWLPWNHGDAGTNAVDVLTGPVTAIRGVATGGAIDWEVLA